MHRKDLIDHIQEWAILILIASASTFMLAASYWCVTYEQQKYPERYEVNLYSQCATQEVD